MGSSTWPVQIAIRRALSQRAGLAACLALTLKAFLVTDQGPAEDKVSLQLKWLHQFQFAGYYAALDRGFYRNAGLDVDISGGRPQYRRDEGCRTRQG